MRIRSVVTACAVILITFGDTYGRPETQEAKLNELSRTFAERLASRRPQLYYDMLASDDPVQNRLNNNPDIQLMFIDDRGKPTFYITTNLTAARTISTDEVWPGGSGGFSLNGSGTSLGRLGIWDGGGVLMAHQEFGGRVTQMDSPASTHYHATHVAGTMIGAGVNASAKGMSFAAYLAAYDWNSDNAEMAAAAATGLNVSNHSYGFGHGWYWDSDESEWYWLGDISISTVEEYGFGFYSDWTRDWDDIAYNAPYYSIVKSAGNDRNDYGPGSGGGHYVWDSGDWVWSTDTRDPDGGTDGYDCVGMQGTAKNIITVGAINDIPGGWTAPGDVAMSTFSGWGPTDDGRIKPDIVANGIGLYSCTDANTSAYASYSGTSMSSPNLSGSLSLLVQYYETTHSSTTPLASTMKALIIHAADEAGPNPGPDYMFGWGLMNTLAAAELIQADSVESGRIVEASLANGQTNQYGFNSNGSEPILVTLAWTDPPGTPPSVALNPTTLMLVSDLDLRLEHVATSTVYEPYVLDPSNPSYAATTGDNFRDNVEQIYVASPPAGQYMISVSHKGSLGSAQDYSLVRSADYPSCVDTDADGICDDIDPDDDNDGVPDVSDIDPLDPDLCEDSDADGCDDCSIGTDDFGPLADNDPSNDGTDTDADGLCDAGDPDDDNDGVPDGSDIDPLDPHVCQDSDADGCDDCSVGTDDFGPLADNLPDNDGTDTDADGLCDSGDPCVNDPDNDIDEDGHCADVDNCPTVANPGQEDTDGIPPGDACCCVGIRGNANGDGDNFVNISDVTYLVDHLFGMPLGPIPPCPNEGNANGDGSGFINISDVTFLVEHLFGVPLGPAPPACP